MISTPQLQPDLDHVAPGGSVIRRARLRAGLTQHDLAKRLGTSQSLVARWEGGDVEPGFSTVVRAVRTCGFELEFRIANYDFDHDRLIAMNLRASPEDRLRRMQQFTKELATLRGKAR